MPPATMLLAHPGTTFTFGRLIRRWGMQTLTLKCCLLVLACLANALAQRLAADPRVRITAPVAGQQYAPGQTIWITVEITPPLTAKDIAVRVPGLGRLPGTNYTGSRYQASLVIPEGYAGELTLIPAVSDSLNTPIRGAELTVAVRPETAPTRLVLITDFYLIDDPPPTSERISVHGEYAGGVERVLSSAAAGTTFRSSNPDVLTVDADGKVTTVARGTAVVTVENSGVKATAVFVVEDLANPLPPQAITALQTSRSTPVLDTQSGFYRQNLRVGYPGGIGGNVPDPIVGPLFVVLSGLPAGVTLMSESGTSSTLAPVGSPYVEIPLPNGVTLKPGESVTIPLEFLNLNGRKITYSTRVYRTLAVP